MSDEEKLVSHYRLKTLLRRDGFGAVYFAEDTRDQKEYVLRVIELDQATLTRITGRVRARSQRDHPLIEQIRQRMKRISELKNSHILPVIEFGEEHIQGNNDIIFYMVSPYEKESLLSYWSAHTSSGELISLEIVTELIFQAAEALYYTHRRGLIHQYVRLSSFMLRSTARSRKLHLYLTDFWFADITLALLEEGQISQDLSIYLAAEQLSGHAVAASDQYALAILAYELLLGYRLSRVDLSFGLYERFVRQRGSEVSEAELELARRLDLVLMRALAEDATVRYQNIEEFAFVFRSVARGEVIDLQEEDTARLTAIAGGERRSRSAEEIAAAAAGALLAGEIVGEMAETQLESDETTHARRSGLHKTVLTSEGMAVGESGAGGEVVEETILNETAQGGTFLAEEETITVIEEEKRRSSSSGTGAAGAAGFAAGLAAGEALQREASLSEEQRVLAESNAVAFAAGEAHQRELDLSEEHTEVRESSSAAFAAGAAAGLIAGEAIGFEQEIDISSEQTQIIPASGVGAGAGGAAILEQETDIADEQTRIIPASGGGIGIGGALLAGGAGLAAGELLASGGSATGAIGGSAAGTAGGLAAGAGAAGSAGLAAGAAGAYAGGAAGAGLAAGAAGGSTAGAAGAYAGGTAGMGVLSSSTRPRRRRRFSLLAAILLLLLLIIIGGGIAGTIYAQGPYSATVTLTLQNRTIQNTYLVTAMTSTSTTSTTTTSGQVQANLLTQTAMQSKSGQASGYYSGSQASGFIKFYNSSTGCGCPIIIPAGTAFTGASGVTVVTDEVASVASLCYVTVHAHAVIDGFGGDIPANDIQANYNSKITAKNPYAFSGGQAGQSNALVQQSDINRLASGLQTKVVQSAQAALQAQVKSNQHLFAQPTCQTKTTSDHAAGDYASNFTVTVKATCTAEAYDYSAAVQIAQQQIQTEASSSYASDQFILSGVETTVTNSAVIDAKAGTLLLAIRTTGKWIFKLSPSKAQIYATAISGKSVTVARSILNTLNGVARVDISVSGFNSNMLPYDSSKITIVLKS